MTDETNLITVYRSADADAEEDAKAIQDLLLKGGFQAELLDDEAPGVVQGTYEVRVPQAEVSAAEALIGERAIADDPADVDGPGLVDPSHDLDLVTVAMTDGTTGEMEATAIQSVLDANEIDSVIIGTSTIPSVGFEVRVAEEDVASAEEAIIAAKAAGPDAALEAEQAGERLPS